MKNHRVANIKKNLNMIAVKRNFNHFLQNTTLHGLKYIAEDKITIFERVLFGLAFLFVVILSISFISNIYNKWSATPIIITTSASQMLTSDVPFPSITICNLNLAQKSKVKSIKKSILNDALLLSLCDQNGDSSDNRGTWLDFKSILKEVAQPCEEMMLYCSFGGKAENCSIMFYSMLTDDGLCCNFNALDSKFMLRNYTEENQFTKDIDNPYVGIDWTPEKGYQNPLPEYFFPRASAGTGTHMGLIVVLNASTTEYYCSKSRSLGFKVLVHNPAELPKISDYGFLITAGREARIPIHPIYQDAELSIRSIKQNIRRCLFTDEGNLLYYRTYSLKSCEMECEAKYLMEKCNCILYYLPRINPNMRICGPRDNACTDNVQFLIDSSSSNLSCSDCLPGCFELSYMSSLSSAAISSLDFLIATEYPTNYFKSQEIIANISVMHFYYASNTMRSTRKSEMFGFTDFLSNTGGLLSLFMGFSIFSLIEIIFYITVRPYCASRALERAKRRKEKEIRWVTSSNKNNRKTSRVLLMQKSMLKNRFEKSINRTLLHRDNKVLEGSLVFPYVD